MSSKSGRLGAGGVAMEGAPVDMPGQTAVTSDKLQTDDAMEKLLVAQTLLLIIFSPRDLDHP